VIKTESSDWW